jgi:hypothetical protein
MGKTSVLIIGAAALALATAGSVLAAAGGGTPRVATLTGAAEFPDADPDGSGTAVIRVNYGQKRVCWQLSVANIVLPAAAAHMHLGAPEVNGGIVVTLSAPDANGKAAGCTALADKTLLKNLIQKPGDYYVNVHNSAYPGGAVRGQLSKPGEGTPKPGKPVK